MLQKTCTTRFAPSPTGLLHLGSLRTALYNFLWAKNQGGKFVLRIEDTDQTRTVPSATRKIISTLTRLGLIYDHGPSFLTSQGQVDQNDGYVQSNRLAIYRKHAELLISKQAAYYCFCGEARLTALKAACVPGNTYDRYCLSLTANEIRQKLAHQRHVVRFKMPDIIPQHRDLVLGLINMMSFNGKFRNQKYWFQDPVLIKSDGFPTYHFASVVDDHLMNITHIIRGQEWVPSIHKHIAIYRAFGWQIPLYAHVPLLIEATGSKLSKRNSSSLIDSFLDKGYLPESMNNFVALLGWQPSKAEFMANLEEMATVFSINCINKSAAQVNYTKLDYFNNLHIQYKLSTILGTLQVVEAASQILLKAGIQAKAEYIESCLRLIAQRLANLSELTSTFLYLFKPPVIDKYTFVYKIQENMDLAEYCKLSLVLLLRIVKVLPVLSTTLNKLEFWKSQEIDQCLRSTPLKISSVLKSIRLILTGSLVGPGLDELMQLLGKQECLDRIRSVEDYLKKLA